MMSISLTPKIIPGVLHSTNKDACDWYVFNMKLILGFML